MFLKRVLSAPFGEAPVGGVTFDPRRETMVVGCWDGTIFAVAPRSPLRVFHRTAERVLCCWMLDRNSFASISQSDRGGLAEVGIGDLAIGSWRSTASLDLPPIRIGEFNGPLGYLCLKDGEVRGVRVGGGGTVEHWRVTGEAKAVKLSISGKEVIVAKEGLEGLERTSLVRSGRSTVIPLPGILPSRFAEDPYWVGYHIVAQTGALFTYSTAMRRTRDIGLRMDINSRMAVLEQGLLVTLGKEKQIHLWDLWGRAHLESIDADYFPARLYHVARQDVFTVSEFMGSRVEVWGWNELRTGCTQWKNFARRMLSRHPKAPKAS